MEILNFQLQRNSYLHFNDRFKILHSNWRERKLGTKVLVPRKVSWEEDISETVSVTGVFIQISIQTITTAEIVRRISVGRVPSNRFGHLRNRGRNRNRNYSAFGSLLTELRASNYVFSLTVKAKYDNRADQFQRPLSCINAAASKYLPPEG